MATRPTQAAPNRQGGYGGNSGAGNSVDVGHVAVTRMAREDTRWFIAGVIVLSVVLFFALPMSLLIYVDTAKMQAEVRYEVKQMKKLRKELKEQDEKDARGRSDAGASSPDGL